MRGYVVEWLYVLLNTALPEWGDHVILGFSGISYFVGR
jgi:hypothetical protein